MQDCFWSQFKPDPHPFCEAQLCQLIGQPANTWTNVGYFIVAILIFRNRDLCRHRVYFAWATLILAIGSTLFHMGNAFWAKKIDVGAMLLLSGVCLALSVQRRFKISYQAFLGLFGFLFLISFPFVGQGKWGGRVFFIQSVIAAGFEMYTAHAESFREWWRDRFRHANAPPVVSAATPEKLRNKSWIMPDPATAINRALIIFPIALILNMNDQNGNLCWPDNHIFTVHGLWHLMTAYVIYSIAIYYSTTCHYDHSK